MLGNFVQATHIAAGLMFILALAGLRRRETARRSTAFGILGMVFALVAAGVAIAHDGLIAGSAQWDSAALLCAAVLTGAVIGGWKGRRAEMAAVPGLVALFQSLSGATAMLVSLNAHLVPAQSGALYSAEVVLGLSTGALVLGGSLVAWARQDDRIAVRVLTPPGGVWTGLAVAAVVVGLGWWYVVTLSLIPLLLLVLSSLALGYHLAAVPRGADVPVAVAALGSCSGWAVVLAGLLLDQSVLVIAGALAGVFGAVLAYDMCRSMSRPPGAALLGAFKNTNVLDSGVGEEPRVVNPADVATMLAGARSVLIVPGHDMAAAQAQRPIAEISSRLRERGIRVRFAIHPVAGRFPGHLNVLLAEAGVPYDSVLEVDEANDCFTDTDVVLVAGASDTVNPAAGEPGFPAAGMPVLRVWEAGQVVVFTRSLEAGRNPLLHGDNSVMCPGDVRASLHSVLARLAEPAR